jgi:hypothetical protein
VVTTRRISSNGSMQIASFDLDVRMIASSRFA